VTAEGERAIVIPCSGIGKTYGSVTREAAYEVTETLCPTRTQLAALSLLVLGDEKTVAAVKSQPVVTLDGCPKECARKTAESCGASRVLPLRVIDTHRRHGDLKPTGIAELNSDGLALARALAGEVAVLAAATLTITKEE